MWSVNLIIGADYISIILSYCDACSWKRFARRLTIADNWAEFYRMLRFSLLWLNNNATSFVKPNNVSLRDHLCWSPAWIFHLRGSCASSLNWSVSHNLLFPFSPHFAALPLRAHRKSNREKEFFVRYLIDPNPKPFLESLPARFKIIHRVFR